MDQILARAGCAFAFCFLLSSAGALGTTQKNEKFLTNQIDEERFLNAFTENEYDIVNRLWSICKQDTVKPETSSELSDVNKKYLDSILSPNAELRNSIDMLPPQIKDLLLDCLGHRSPPGEEEEEEGEWIKFNVQQELEDFLGWYTERRVLGERQGGTSSSIRGSIYDFSPAPAPAPFSHGNHGNPPAPSPASLSQISVPSPSQQFQPPPPPPPPPAPPPPPGHFVVFSPPISITDERMKSPPFVPPDEQLISTRGIELLVGLTALSTLLFVAILFCCYIKFFGHGSSGNFYKDDRPLLALSRSDFSVGSTPRSQVSNNFLADSHRVEKGKGSFGTYPFSLTPSRSKLSNEGEIKLSNDAEIKLPNDAEIKFSNEAEISSDNPMQTLESLFHEGDSVYVASKKFSSTSVPVGNSEPESFKPTTTPAPPPTPTPTLIHTNTSSPTPPAPPPPAPPPPPPPRPLSSAPPPSPPLPPPPAARAPPPPPPQPSGGKPSPQPPPPPMGGKPGPQSPPPPMGSGPRRPPPPKMNTSKAAPPPPRGGKLSEKQADETDENGAPKAKLKPFFWDKVNANPSHAMVWDQIKSGSFQFNEEMIESLFGANSTAKPKAGQKKGSGRDDSVPQPQILDPKKSQNLSILLRALNVTIEEVRDALLEGNELSVELIQTLSKMEPTAEEEFKLRVYTGDLVLLGPAERFLKTLVDIPFAFKRLDALLFMGILEEDAGNVKTSLRTLEVACEELKNSRLFMKLLEAVLKTGNRMNDGTYRGGAQAFKLDTLLKLSDVKGTDGKTTLLHFVVKEIIRSEGRRALRAARGTSSMSSLNSMDSLDELPPETGDHLCSLGLQVVSGLSEELQNVKKAAAVDADMLTSTLSTLGTMLLKTKKFLNSEMQCVEESERFIQTMTCFVEQAEIELTRILSDEKRIMALVKTTTDYFHGNSNKDEGLRLFVIVRDFLTMLDKACKDVQEAPKRVAQTPRTKGQAVQIPNPRNLLFPAISNLSNRSVDSSDDEESP